MGGCGGGLLSQPFEDTRPWWPPPFPCLYSQEMKSEAYPTQAPLARPGAREAECGGPWLGLAWLVSRACLGLDVGTKLSLTTPGS